MPSTKATTKATATGWASLSKVPATLAGINACAANTDVVVTGRYRSADAGVSRGCYLYDTVKGAMPLTFQTQSPTTPFAPPMAVPTSSEDAWAQPR